MNETTTYSFANLSPNTPYTDGEVTLQKTEGAELSGWNLVGNPFIETAYIDKNGFYRMNYGKGNTGGNEIILAETNAVAPMEGIFVYAEKDGDTMTFYTQEPIRGYSSKPAPEQLVLNLSRPSTPSTGSGTEGSGTGSTSSVIDRAIVRMGGPSTGSGASQTLPKFQIRENSTKIYLPQGGKDYAVASSNGRGEMPVNFRAKENGTYTITVNTEGVEMEYLHLIDNKTGADIDLLSAGDRGSAPAMRGQEGHCGLDPQIEDSTMLASQSPTPSYTFEAKTTDYESRFKLVFAINEEDGPSTPSTGSGTEGSGTFAFYSNGNWIINNPSTGSGSATLQVVDLNGRILSSESIHGSVSKSIHAAAGVYVLRLINGDEVRTQKIVVE